MDQESKPVDIRFLPTDGLEIPDWNPRKTMSESGLAALEAYVNAGGIIPRIWVWGGDGKSVISGQRRLAVYRRLGKAQIEAEILHISLEEAKRLATSSNRMETVPWLEEYEGWEPYLKAGTRLTEEEIGALVGVEADWIGRAKKLLAVLNPASRKLIRESWVEDPSTGSPMEPAHPNGPRLSTIPMERQRPNHAPRLVGSAQDGLFAPFVASDQGKNKGNNDVSEDFGNIKKPLKKRISKNEKKRGFLEDAAFPLTTLWNKRSIQDVQALVEKALPVILAREMKGPQVKALVKWVSAGNDPEAFGKTPPVSPVRETVGSKEAKAVSAPNSKLLTSNSAKAASPPDLPTQVGTAIASHELGKRLHLPGQLMNRLLPGLTRLFHGARGLFAWVGIKNAGWATFLTLLLFLLAANFLIHFTGRVMNGFWNVRFNPQFNESATWSTRPIPGGIGNPVAGGPSQVGQPSAATASVSAPSSSAVSQVVSVPAHLSPGPQAGGQGEVSGNGHLVPSQSGSDTGVTQAGSAQVANSSTKLAQPNRGPQLEASAQVKQVSNPSQSPTPAKGGDVLAQIGADVKNYQNAVNTADQAKSTTDKVKGIFGF